MHLKDTGTESNRRPELDTVFIKSFCKKWRIREFSLFGSILREDFEYDSDVDVLVEKDGLRNPYRRREVLDHREVLYVA